LDLSLDRILNDDDDGLFQRLIYMQIYTPILHSYRAYMDKYCIYQIVSCSVMKKYRNSK